MTVRELIQTILVNTPDLDAEVYIGKPLGNGIDVQCYTIKEIYEQSNDSLHIDLEDWRWEHE